MKVLETIKPAMKAKQIMMEFAIERTWKHDEGEFVIKAGLSKIALKQEPITLQLEGLDALCAGALYGGVIQV